MKKGMELQIDGKTLQVSNVDKVLFPASGFTKGEIINYYVRMSTYLLPHMKDRPLTLKRYPEGIDKEHFYEKDAPRFTPEWVKTFAVPRKGRASKIDYILVNDLATLVWTVNLANIEMHTFLARAPALDQPTMAVFDLDPGPPASVIQCAEVALRLKELLDRLKLQSWAKSSGSKGIQVYIPLNTKTDYEQTSTFAHDIARLLEERHPDLVVSDMAKSLRTGKVFIDWSQNAEHKSTVTVYSLRAKRDEPYVSIPLTWEEIEEGLRKRDEGLFFLGPDQAIKRVEGKGELFEPVTRMKQRIPADYKHQLESAPEPRRTSARPVESLQAYRAKRDFTKTKEPPPLPTAQKTNGEDLMFVIQKHAASHLHYDFRLEMEGVLRSWAVPKGIPTSRQEKRLAMHVEDHPMEYARFEGTIPQGSYGGGTVMVWDIGTWQAKDGHPVRGFYTGKLPLVLRGKKLKGEWALVRKARNDGKKDEWLLLKTGKDIKPISSRTDNRSVLSGRTMEQIATAKGPVWISNRDGGEQPQAAAQPAVDEFQSVIKKLPRAKPQYVDPMLAKMVYELPEGAKWLYEIKLDGYRAVAVREGTEKARLFSRNTNDLGGRYPEIVEGLLALPAKSFVLDGEIVALDPDGAPSFELLQNMGGGSGRPLYYYAFDLVNLDGHDLRKLPLAQRKQILKSLVGGAGADIIRFSPAIEADARTLINEVRKRKLEGIVAKLTDSLYENGKRAGSWVKYKTENEQEFVIGGVKGGKGAFDSLLVGYYDGGKLRFAGKVKAGFTQHGRKRMAALFESLAATRCPFVDVPESKSSRWGEGLTREDMEKAVWLKPKLVCRVQFLEWTAGGHLRHAKFVALRDDIDPKDVRKD